MKRIQENVDKCVTTSQIGQIPHKISPNFSKNANEWKNWTPLFSLLALHGILPQEYLTCWQLFVNACSIMSSTILSGNQITSVQDLMHQFFVSAEALFDHR